MTTGPDDPASTPPAPPNPYGGTPSQDNPPPQPYAGPGQPYDGLPYGSQPYGGQPYGAPPQTYGQPGYPMPGYHAPPPNDGLALGAMIVGIISMVLACGYGIGLLGSPAALIMGRISLKRIDRSQGQLGGRGMAMAGFVLGIVGTVLLVLAIIAVVVVVILAVNGNFDNSDY